MSRQPKTFWLILIFGVLLRLFLVFALPLYPAENFLPGYNDEPMHLNYVRHVAETRHWPVWTKEESDRTTLVDEFPQPPLYYFIAAPAYLLGERVGAGYGIFGARLISLLFGTLTPLIIYWICKKILGNRRGAMAGLAFATFSPNMVIFSSLITNDSLLLCLSALAIASIIVVRNNVGGTVCQLKAGLVLGAAVWAKMSALALLPLVWFVAVTDLRPGIIWQARRRTALAAMVVILPLLIWNGVHYRQVVPTVSIYLPEEGGHSGSGIQNPISAIKYLARTSAQPFEQTWGSLPEKVSTTIWLLIVTGVFLYGVWHLRNVESRWLVLGGIALPAIALVYYNIRFFQIEARLLAPAVASLSIFVAAGMRRLNVPIGWQCVLWSAPLSITLTMFLFN